MNYNISVKEFLEKGKDIDYNDFHSSLMNQIKKLNKKFNLLQCINEEKSAAKAKLFGLPISVKDNICTKGLQSSAGSRILNGYIPPMDATAVSKLKQAGGTVIGKTNQDEFGFGTFSVNCGYAVPKNPLDPTRSCGGSSGGAAGLVASLDHPNIALAESTGGSISCPAAFCSVVGLTPTYGLVSRYGLIDFANSLDKIGSIGKSVYDVALLLSVIAGHDPKEPTTINKATKDYTKYLSKSIKGMKIGIPKEYFNNVDKQVEKAVRKAVEQLEALGAKTKEISLPNTKYTIPAYYIIATAEASTNLAKFCGMRYGLHLELEGNFNEYFSRVRSKGFGDEAKRRAMLGTFVRMSGYRDAYYLKAMKVRTLIIQDFKKAFKSCDVIAAPTMPILPPKFTEIAKLTPLEHYQMDILTGPANTAGVPMISIPTKPKQPVGLHLIGDHLQEEKILRVASAYEAKLR